MKRIAVSVLAGLAIVAFAHGNQNTNGPARVKMTPEERRAASYARTGGILVRGKVTMSKIAVIDSQSLADIQTNLMPVLTKYGEMTKASATFVYERAEPKAADKLMSESKAAFAVIVVANDNDPSIAILPEDRYAIVNTKKLTRGFKSIETRKELYDNRCAKATLKATAMLLGSGGSKFRGNLLDTVKMEDLDMANLALPIDVIVRIGNYLNAAGIPQINYSTYLKACQEGWAPAPTNDVQKAIWDKVHALPTNPMKIEFDPKKGR